MISLVLLDISIFPIVFLSPLLINNLLKLPPLLLEEVVNTLIVAVSGVRP